MMAWIKQRVGARDASQRATTTVSVERDESSEMKTLDSIHFLQSKLHRVYIKFGDTTQIPQRFRFACKCEFQCLNLPMTL